MIKESVPSGLPPLSTRELLLLEQGFRAHVDKAKRPDYQCSRLRLFFLFLLVRYAALRLGEALHVDDEKDIDLSHAALHISGAQARDIPLSEPLTAELRRLLSHPALLGQRGTISALDPGYVRRNFYARAKECGFAPEQASPRALREARAVEMIESGMPLPAVQKFLGQSTLESTGDLAAYSDDDILLMTQNYLRRETSLKTSARNVFPATVEHVRKNGFLVEVAMHSFTGLRLITIITEESLANLQLSPGKTVVATVKAPWVVLGKIAQPTRNHFQGTLVTLQRSELVCEAGVELPEGSRICALISTTTADALNLCLGDAVTVSFKAFAVILTLP